MSAFLVANIAPLMFATLAIVLLIGYPVAFSLAAVGIGWGLVGINHGLLQPTLLQALPERIWGVMSNDTLLAVPFFTFMGLILERSGMAEDLLDTVGQLQSFTGDATTTFEGWHGTVKDFLQTRSNTAPGPKRVQIMDHFISNISVFLDDESHGRAHSYHLCTHTTTAHAPDGPQDRIVVGRYFDWVVKTSVGWRIRHRDVVFDWSMTVPVGERTWAAHLGSPDMLVGTNDETDPFFARFGSIDPFTSAQRSPSDSLLDKQADT